MGYWCNMKQVFIPFRLNCIKGKGALYYQRDSPAHSGRTGISVSIYSIAQQTLKQKQTPEQAGMTSSGQPLRRVSSLH
ncbi:hypothetical protein A8C56_06555 [Niabella ginsenosidivorans]|uniref:Uncharacterized protein n=1 Tax=Niabella ginsenosidivorans TaxID=1176587 RepID=A0A1A9I283_9BACT|nr:hypothetical protein A8C56_06555 [Niabella ginsenosidivorans]